MNRHNKAIKDTVNAGVSKHIGSYSDAIMVRETEQGVWVFTSGTPGVDDSGKYPDNIMAQSKQAWKNILEILAASKLSINDIIKITATVTDQAYIAPYVASRNEILGDLKPALMLSVVKETFKPEILIEIEVIAYGVPNDRK